MFTAKNYVLVKEVAEAYELNQKKNNAVLGGMLWLKLGKRKLHTAIDLSGLGLDLVEETEDSFQIGCMVTLRTLEMDERLNKCFGGLIRTAVSNIVGVQFRNLATVGGSIFGRYGFSDLLSALLVLDSYVELYQGGIMPLAEFAMKKTDCDILVRIMIKKDGRRAAYFSRRISSADFPVLNVAVSQADACYQVAVGARPGRARVVTDREGILAGVPDEHKIEQFLGQHQHLFTFQSNMRGSSEYRRQLAKVFIKRGCKAIAGGNYAD